MCQLEDNSTSHGVMDTELFAPPDATKFPVSVSACVSINTNRLQ